MPKLSFSQRLQQPQPILADGAMGTMLHQRGIEMHLAFDALNLTDPEFVFEIHRAYLHAGAELIETNTFGANRFKLTEHGYADQVDTINRAGVAIAQRAIRDIGEPDRYIAGSVGPLGVRLKPYGRITTEEAIEAFVEQIGALVDAGVDAIIFETFADHTELLLALKAARQVAPSIPVICQATFAPDDRTLPGFTPSKVAFDLYKAGADVIGVNCSGGPSQISNILTTMRQCVPDAKLSVMPNAGYPEAIGGRIMYPATADYFGDYALTFKAIGASIIGGCCGTTPAHIRAMREALDDPSKPLPEISVIEMNGDESDQKPERPTDLARRLASGHFTITVEIAPPRSYTVDKLLRSARLLRDAGADILDVADTPAARMRMSPWAVSHLIQSQVGIETVLHFPTRGRNLLRIQGDLLAAHAMDLRNLFVTMGDPTKIGDYPDAMDNYDIVPSKLIALIKHNMNTGVDQAGNSIGKPTNFTVGCALNMFADDLDREIKVLGDKLAAGADFALGQAVFEPEKIERFLRRYEELRGEPFRLPVLIGIMPLYNLKHATFLHNEVPGIVIPDTILKQMEDAGDRGPEVGVKIAQNILREIQGLVAGAYIIPAFSKYELAAEVISAVSVIG
ncbi:MAG: bifunctional homocysteine S-methyltransferase/methylenetetrahydrofolate reductase [Anaerolineae bacterium]|nr:bifunctional homocysteine S-methyltransferase/methylenetetrahydrofolate reductase [Anaerolineae bacterium]